MIEFAAQVVVNGVLSGAIYILMAIGFTLIFGVMRIVNFAHGELYMIGASLVLLLYGHAGVNYYFALALATLGTAALGVVLEKTLFGPFVKTELNSMIMSLGVSISLQASALILLGPDWQSIARPVSGTIQLGTVIIPLDRLFVSGCALVILIFFYLFLKQTRAGLAMQAVAQDAEVAALMGVRAGSVSALAFAIGAGLAAVAGGLMAPIYSIAPYMGQLPLIKAFVIVILGGLGSIPGAIVGGLSIGLIESIFASTINTTISLIASFAIVVIVLLFRPQGIFGKKHDA